MRLLVVWSLSTAAWDIIQLGQTFIMISGLFLGSVIVSRSILYRRSSPGDFIVRFPSFFCPPSRTSADDRSA